MPARAVDSQPRKALRQPVGGQLAADPHGEAKPAQESSDGGFAAAEPDGGKRLLPRQVPERDADDGLRVIGLAVVNEHVLAGRVMAVPLQELVLPELVVLFDGFDDRVVGDVLEGDY